MTPKDPQSVTYFSTYLYPRDGSLSNVKKLWLCSRWGGYPLKRVTEPPDIQEPLGGHSSDKGRLESSQGKGDAL